VTTAKEVPFPFIDQCAALDDPSRPGFKLCPRCSNGGKACCSIEPAFKLISGKIVAVHRMGAFADPFGALRQAFGSISLREEDYGKTLWVCAGGCDRDGYHPH
jgi:hypothetical protein